MANEITHNVTLSAKKGTFTLPRVGSSIQLNQTGQGGGVPGQHIATNAAQGANLVTTGVTTLGLIYFKNVDAAAVVDWGPVVAATLHPIGTLNPGDQASFRMKAGAVLAFKSSLATSPIQVYVLES
jgi:hypothetical protein